MVHVEVFLGGGPSNESTIGSRTTSVEYHDSYKFTSPKWVNIEYHFRSIETWLDGVCKSFCPDHTWTISYFTVAQGNNHLYITNKLLLRGLEECGGGMRNTNACRFRWAHKPWEINFLLFEEGRHIVNHLSNSHILTNKVHLVENLRKLDESMKDGLIESALFSDASEFTLRTFYLKKNTQLA